MVNTYAASVTQDSVCSYMMLLCPHPSLIQITAGVSHAIVSSSVGSLGSHC